MLIDGISGLGRCVLVTDGDWIGQADPTSRTQSARGQGRCALEAARRPAKEVLRLNLVIVVSPKIPNTGWHGCRRGRWPEGREDGDRVRHGRARDEKAALFEETDACREDGRSTDMKFPSPS